MHLIKRLSKILCLSAICITAAAQYKPAEVYEEVLAIEGSDISTIEKLRQVEILKTAFDKSRTQPDYVYARMLHRIGLWKYITEKKYSEAIALTLQAVRINLSGHRNADAAFAVNSLANVAFYYNSLPDPDYEKALRYFDSAILLSVKPPIQFKFLLGGHVQRASILYNQGNFQEAYEEAILGLNKKPATGFADLVAGLYYQKATAGIALSKYDDGIKLLTNAENYFQEAADSGLIRESENLTMQAKCAIRRAYTMVSLDKQQQALQYFTKVNLLVQKLEDPDQVAALQVDIGRFFIDSLNDIASAKKYFQKVISLHKQKGCSNAYLAAAYNNLGLAAFKQNQLSRALQWYQLAVVTALGGYAPKSVFENPDMQNLRLLPDKKLLFRTIANKAEMLMLMYKQNQQQQYLQAAYRTFMLADSIVTDMRYSQTGEGSKLFWRKTTRNFYQQALETSWLSNNPSAAFYFMEKSRAALLNDRLNELGAGSILPPAEASGEQTLRLALVEQQIKLSNLNEEDAQYNQLQQQVLTAQDNLVRFIKKLEVQFPAYYQYKYAGEVPSLQDLQQYLRKTNRQFVQYFVGDTALYVLYATGGQTFLFNRSVRNLDSTISDFINSCSSKETQNKSYQSFRQSSYHLYTALLPPLHRQTGSLIISPDNLLIPFDAFCTDATSNRMLVQDYAISYTYSARFLLKPLVFGKKKEGDFLGMAPVSFPAAMQLSPLQSSKAALQSLEEYYPEAKLLLEKNATRRSLLKNISEYTIVNLYTHARADSNSAEPQLFLSDSVIRLSELQMIQKPATQLVVLSACQTNTGKLASGEGVYSIARGLAMAGIPSAVATLWKADEKATYFITREFHKNISQGMAKDVALQQAKLSWLQQSSREDALPFYWANLTLMGNADAIKITNEKQNSYWWYVAGLLLLVVAGWLYRKRRNSRA